MSPSTATWKKGDVVEVHLPMPVQRVLANEKVKADIGRVAVERGPLVYCTEWPDNDGLPSSLVLEDSAPLTAEPRTDLLNGIVVDHGRGDGLPGEGRPGRERESRSSPSSPIIPGPTGAGARWRSGSPGPRTKPG